MPLKQIYATYDRDYEIGAMSFTFCPYCRGRLELKQSGDRIKPVCPGCGYVQFINPSPAVGVLVVDGGKVLLGKRTGVIGGGKWAIPSGYVEFDEDYLSSAIREVKEETGLEVEIQSILNVDSAFLGPQYHFLTVYLLAHVTAGELCAGDDVAEVAWFQADGPLPQMAFQQDVELIRAYAARQLPGLPVDASRTHNSALKGEGS